LLCIDNTSAEFTGTWTSSSVMPNRYLTDYIYHVTGIGTNKVRWRPGIISSGNYSVYYRLPNGDNTRSTNAPFTVFYDGGSLTYLVNEQHVPGGIWTLLGTHSFAAGTTGYVEMTDNANNANVIADAVMFVWNGPKYAKFINAEVANSNDEDLDVTVYPNPTSQGRLFVKFKGYQKERSAKLVMTDNSGRIVQIDNIQTEGFSEYVVHIDVQNLNKGLYIMSVICQNSKKDIKVMIK